MTFAQAPRLIRSARRRREERALREAHRLFVEIGPTARAEQIAWEIGDRGIRVNAIAPGVTTTNAAQNATRLFGSQYLSPAGEQMWKKAIALSLIHI